jgi:putative solute:sodium symporter small subunit
MIEKEYRARHWQSTARNTLLSLGLLAALLLVSSLFTDIFDRWHFLGFPLSYYLACQGAFILMIALLFWSSGRQDEIDRRFGASEEI